MPSAELVNEVLNVVQLLFLAWLAAHYRNGGGGGPGRPPEAPRRPEGGPDRAALDYVHRAQLRAQGHALEAEGADSCPVVA